MYRLAETDDLELQQAAISLFSSRVANSWLASGLLTCLLLGRRDRRRPCTLSRCQKMHSHHWRFAGLPTLCLRFVRLISSRRRQQCNQQQAIYQLGKYWHRCIWLWRRPVKEAACPPRSLVVIRDFRAPTLTGDFHGAMDWAFASCVPCCAKRYCSCSWADQGWR